MGNRALYEFLKKALKNKARDVRKLDEYFKESIHEVEYCPYGSEEVFRNPDRKSYFGRIPAANLAASVILLDPDIGLEAKSMGAKDGEKYVTYEEVASTFGRMDEIVRQIALVDRVIFRIMSPAWET